MSDWNPAHEAVKALFALSVSVVTLGIGWLIGQRLTYHWNIRQKRREFQLSASQQFYSAYGEFFAVWKLWNRLKPDDISRDERRWELHKRAAAAEAIIEGTLVKLSCELILEDHQLEVLGKFRQSFQHLREAIHQDVAMGWTSSEHPNYKAFKDLTVRVAAILSADWLDHPPTSDKAAGQLLRITSNIWSDTWRESEKPILPGH